MRNPERVARIRSALCENQLDLVICALPMNVLLLSGYWPVVGNSIAIASSDGTIGLLVPEDEEDLVNTGWPDEVRTFQPGSLNELISVGEAIRAPLRELVNKLSAEPVRVGFESGETSEPVSYAAMHFYGGTMRPLIDETLSTLTLTSADEVLADLRSRKTDVEIRRIRTACEIAGEAFRHGCRRIDVGASEVKTASVFREPLSALLGDFPALRRADGFAWCMSGVNSALAAGAYAQSRAKRIEAGDLVLIHLNSYADGYWTDVTRTYSWGKLDERGERMYDAIFAAREAAIGAIRPGAKGADVDAAARNILTERGFGPQFKHSTGHGVGFSAISANAKPRLHPKSPDIIETGMVFNVERAIYFEGYGGIRHCDIVAVAGSGAELLTSFQCRRDELLIQS